jgi:hypothetical protein
MKTYTPVNYDWYSSSYNEGIAAMSNPPTIRNPLIFILFIDVKQSMDSMSRFVLIDWSLCRVLGDSCVSTGWEISRGGCGEPPMGTIIVV